MAVLQMLEQCCSAFLVHHFFHAPIVWQAPRQIQLKKIQLCNVEPGFRFNLGQRFKIVPFCMHHDKRISCPPLSF